MGVRVGMMATKVVLEGEEERKAVEGLSPDRLRIFDKENEGMLKHYEDTLEEVRWVCPVAIALSLHSLLMLCIELPNLRSLRSQSCRHSWQQTWQRKMYILTT